MNPETVVSLVQLGADVTRAVLAEKQAGESPSDFARRLVGIGIDMVPISELRAHLDAADAEQAERIADIAEDAKILAKKIRP